MFPASPNSAYSSHNVHLVQFLKESPEQQVFSARYVSNDGQSLDGNIQPATAILRNSDNRMQLQLRSQLEGNTFRPTSPDLRARARWLRIAKDPQSQREFLNVSQRGRQAPLCDEEKLSEFMIAQESLGRYLEVEMDAPVACDVDASVVGTLGAGPCVLGFLVGVMPNGGKPQWAALHRSMSESTPFDPDQAYASIIRPLEEEVTRKAGGVPLVKKFYFAGGNPQTLQSCAALAFAAAQHQLNVPVSMLGINEESTYINAALNLEKHNAPYGGFLVARVVESSDDDS